MSEIKLGSFIDTDNASDIVSDTIGMFKRTLTSVFKEDLFEGKTNFFAVAISNPKQITDAEYTALGFAGAGSKSDKSYKKFKVRITHKRANPHAMLEDPCDITIAADKCAQNALIAAHTTIVTEVNTGVNIGSFVEIKLDKNSDGAYNLQTGHLVTVHQRNETGNTVLNAAVCESVKPYFEFGESYIAAPTITVPNNVDEYAAMYDSSTEIPRKSQHKRFFTLGNERAFTPPFDKWVKALIAAAWDIRQVEVVITDGKRDPVKQQQWHEDWLAGKRAIPASCGLCPNPGKHIPGFAVDMNIHHNGNEINFGSEPRVTSWTDTGLPQIAKELGLTWGGNWTGNGYDPIHFELNPKEWGDRADEILRHNSGRNLDTVDELPEGGMMGTGAGDEVVDDEAPTEVKEAAKSVVFVDQEADSSESAPINPFTGLPYY